MVAYPWGRMALRCAARVSRGVLSIPMLHLTRSGTEWKAKERLILGSDGNTSFQGIRRMRPERGRSEQTLTHGLAIPRSPQSHGRQFCFVKTMHVEAASGNK